MRTRTRGLVALAGAACLVGQYLAVPMVADAQGTTPVPFGAAQFSGYSTGTETQLSSLSVAGSNPLAGVGQGVASAAVAHDGLTRSIVSESGNVVNPAEPASIKAYGSGAGLTLAVAAPTTAEQAIIAGRATASSPPIGPEVTKQVGPINAAPLATVDALNGRADAIYDPAGLVCPLGQPISFGRGDAANVQLANLNLPGGPIANTAGSAGAGTTTANTTSETFLSSNGDNTFGLSTASSEIVAPITLNVLGLIKLQLTIGGATPNSPVTLISTASGEPNKPATVSLADNDAVNLTLSVANGPPQEVPGFPVTPAQLGPGGLHINLSSTTIGSALQAGLGGLTGTQLGSALAPILGPNTPLVTGLSGLLNTLGQAGAPIIKGSLGSIDIDATPHAIGGSVTSPPTLIGGTVAAGAIDLVHLNLDASATLLAVGGGAGIPLPNTTIANLFVGHLESAAALNAPITCPIPVIKTANPPSLNPGSDFVYTIQVPDPAKLALLDCSLVNLSVVDTISDVTPGGRPTFRVLSANNGGQIHQTSTTDATVTFTGLTYRVAPVGQPPNPPVTLQILVSVPKNSPAGTIQDIANATGTTAGCTGGASGQANLGGVNGSTLNGSTRLQAPRVGSAVTPLAQQTGSNPGGGVGSLPRTGGEGGLWQPGLGLAMLILGGGALGLVRRSRRRTIG